MGDVFDEFWLRHQNLLHQNFCLLKNLLHLQFSFCHMFKDLKISGCQNFVLYGMHVYVP